MDASVVGIYILVSDHLQVQTYLHSCLAGMIVYTACVVSYVCWFTPPTPLTLLAVFALFPLPTPICVFHRLRNLQEERIREETHVASANNTSSVFV